MARIARSPVCRAPGLAPGTRQGGSSCFPPPLVGTTVGAAVGSSSPPAAKRQTKVRCHLLGHREPGGTQLKVNAPRLTQRPPPPPRSPRHAPAGSQTVDGRWRCYRDRTVFPALRSCPRSKIHHVITDLGNYCARTEQGTVTEGSRGVREDLRGRGV